MFVKWQLLAQEGSKPQSSGLECAFPWSSTEQMYSSSVFWFGPVSTANQLFYRFHCWQISGASKNKI